MAINKECTPPPVIGKIGPYTVFMTPPSTPKPSEAVVDSPKKIVPPPVQPPPVQMEKPLSGKSVVDGSVLGFFKNAVTKVQNAHTSLDDHLARWFGLNQSKYQWALDDYYESKGVVGTRVLMRFGSRISLHQVTNACVYFILMQDQGDIKVKEISSKVQSM